MSTLSSIFLDILTRAYGPNPRFLGFAHATARNLRYRDLLASYSASLAKQMARRHIHEKVIPYLLARGKAMPPYTIAFALVDERFLPLAWAVKTAGGYVALHCDDRQRWDDLGFPAPDDAEDVDLLIDRRFLSKADA